MYKLQIIYQAILLSQYRTTPTPNLFLLLIFSPTHHLQNCTKLNIFERDWFKFDQGNFILDYLGEFN